MNEEKVLELAMELCRVEQRSIKDFTKKGRCAKCGECCSNLLPLAQSEVERIIEYVKTHQINISKPKNGSCPFLSKEKRCLVYEARPLVCRLFKCSAPTPSYKDFKLLLREDRAICDVKLTFSVLETHCATDAR